MYLVSFIQCLPKSQNIVSRRAPVFSSGYFCILKLSPSKFVFLDIINIRGPIYIVTIKLVTASISI